MGGINRRDQQLIGTVAENQQGNSDQVQINSTHKTAEHFCDIVLIATTMHHQIQRIKGFL